MNIKIHPGKIKYYEYEGGKISAVITNCQYDLIDFMIENNLYPVDQDKDLYLNKSYVGTATCGPDDTYDFETGKKIARKKAILKYREAIIRTYYRHINKVNNRFDMISTMLNSDWEVAQKSYEVTMKEVE